MASSPNVAVIGAGWVFGLQVDTFPRSIIERLYNSAGGLALAIALKRQMGYVNFTVRSASFFRI